MPTWSRPTGFFLMILSEKVTRKKKEASAKLRASFTFFTFYSSRKLVHYIKQFWDEWSCNISRFMVCRKLDEKERLATFSKKLGKLENPNKKYRFNIVSCASYVFTKRANGSRTQISRAQWLSYYKLLSEGEQLSAIRKADYLSGQSDRGKYQKVASRLVIHKSFSSKTTINSSFL